MRLASATSPWIVVLFAAGLWEGEERAIRIHALSVDPRFKHNTIPKPFNFDQASAVEPMGKTITNYHDDEDMDDQIPEFIEYQLDRHSDYSKKDIKSHVYHFGLPKKNTGSSQSVQSLYDPPPLVTGEPNTLSQESKNHDAHDDVPSSPTMKQDDENVHNLPKSFGSKKKIKKNMSPALTIVPLPRRSATAARAKIATKPQPALSPRQPLAKSQPKEAVKAPVKTKSKEQKQKRHWNLSPLARSPTKVTPPLSKGDPKAAELSDFLLVPMQKTSPYASPPLKTVPNLPVRDGVSRLSTGFKLSPNNLYEYGEPEAMQTLSAPRRQPQQYSSSLSSSMLSLEPPSKMATQRQDLRFEAPTKLKHRKATPSLPPPQSQEKEEKEEPLAKEIRQQAQEENEKDLHAPVAKNEPPPNVYGIGGIPKVVPRLKKQPFGKAFDLPSGFNTLVHAPPPSHTEKKQQEDKESAREEMKTTPDQVVMEPTTKQENEKPKEEIVETPKQTKNTKEQEVPLQKVPPPPPPPFRKTNSRGERQAVPLSSVFNKRKEKAIGNGGEQKQQSRLSQRLQPNQFNLLDSAAYGRNKRPTTKTYYLNPKKTTFC